MGIALVVLLGLLYVLYCGVSLSLLKLLHMLNLGVRKSRPHVYRPLALVAFTVLLGVVGILVASNPAEPGVTRTAAEVAAVWPTSFLAMMAFG